MQCKIKNCEAGWLLKKIHGQSVKNPSFNMQSS
jgi:hypothetical protein